jgi:hypothetical protein
LFYERSNFVAFPRSLSAKLSDVARLFPKRSPKASVPSTLPTSHLTPKMSFGGFQGTGTEIMRQAPERVPMSESVFRSRTLLAREATIVLIGLIDSCGISKNLFTSFANVIGLGSKKTACYQELSACVLLKKSGDGCIFGTM